MAKEIKNQTKQMDNQLLKEKKRTVADIVAKATKKKLQTKQKSPKKKELQGKTFDNKEPLNEYMEGVLKKRKKNWAKLKSLGLGTPPTLQSQAKCQCKMKRKSPRNISAQGKKNSPAKKRPKSSRRFFEDEDIVKICTCDHKDISRFKEETDKQYFLDGGELFDTSCAICGVKFTYETNENNEAVYVPDMNNPAYFCIG